MSEDEQCFAVAKNANRHNQEVGSFREREFHMLLLLAVAAAFLLLNCYFLKIFRIGCFVSIGPARSSKSDTDIG